MELKNEKLARFSNDGKFNLEKPMQVYKIPKILFPDGKISIGDTDNDKNRMNIKFPRNHEQWKKRILDPGSDIFLEWKRAFLFSSILSLFVDPLFFYLPSVAIATDKSSSCMVTDLNLGIVVTCFRTFADVFYLLNMIIKFRTAFVSPSSRVFGRGELVMDLGLIARRYLRSEFFLDLFAALPLPQIVIWFIMPAIRSSHADHTNNALVLIVLIQYVPRLYMIFPLSSQIVKATGVVTKTAWAGAAYNLLLYLLASHVLGASCTINDDDRTKWANTTSLFGNCTPESSTSFKYGIFGIAVENNVLSSVFIEKYLYCLWWGLQNLSSYGQGLTTSTFVWETAFAILISIVGLVLFAHLIGNMQTYLQSITVRLEEWRLKRRDTEEWMKHRQLPQFLRERVRRFVQYKWLATRGVDEETILRGLPTDLRRDIQRHLCLDLVRRVPFFSQMDDQLLDAICERLAAWRRFKKRVLANSLSLREYKSFIDEQVRDQMEREEEEHSSVTSNTAQVKQNLGVTILASRFAANTRKGVQKIKDVEMLKLQKPEEPDFSVEPEDD
ncbi:hypothetical protein P8452_29214 [Trifolium repens]|nr:hypothetical protein P8452_29214 [Trifolium repens]